MRGKAVTRMEVLVMKIESICSWREEWSGVWDMLSLRCLFSMYMER